MSENVNNNPVEPVDENGDANFPPHDSHVWEYSTNLERNRWTCKNCGTEKGSYYGGKPCTNPHGEPLDDVIIPAG